MSTRMNVGQAVAEVPRKDRVTQWHQRLRPLAGVRCGLKFLTAQFQRRIWHSNLYPLLGLPLGIAYVGHQNYMSAFEGRKVRMPGGP